jgi:hypothetical protein
VNTVTFSDEEIYIRAEFDRLRLKHFVGDQIVYGPDPDHGAVLIFGLNSIYLGMLWRSVDQRASRKSLARGHSSGLDEHGDPDKHMEELLKLPSNCLEEKESTEKNFVSKLRLSLARKLQLKIDKRSEKLLSGIDYLCGILHRPPTKLELRLHVKMEKSTFSEALCDTGFNWLPMRKPGRKVSRSHSNIRTISQLLFRESKLLREIKE